MPFRLATKRGCQPGEMRRDVGVHQTRSFGKLHRFLKTKRGLPEIFHGHELHAFGQQDLGFALDVTAGTGQFFFQDLFGNFAAG